MNKVCKTPYGTWADKYRSLGLEVRPGQGKSCKIPGWQKPDSEFLQATFDKWKQDYGGHNLLLKTGTILPDGNKLGAFDIDHDDCLNLGKALLGSASGRVGKKGGVLFFRYSVDFPTGKKKISVNSKEFADKYDKPVAEWLIEGALCVLPPSIHPETRKPYEWIGTPLHEIDLTTLPFIGDK
ncbi:MAG: bifunctional DNA primase/polymerase [Pseudomonadota bacterium]|nr:bifunctional DNA primase/polymerase [Pseudomonadota bacterium]